MATRFGNLLKRLTGRGGNDTPDNENNTGKGGGSGEPKGGFKDKVSRAVKKAKKKGSKYVAKIRNLFRRR